MIVPLYLYLGGRSTAFDALTVLSPGRGNAAARDHFGMLLSSHSLILAAISANQSDGESLSGDAPTRSDVDGMPLRLWLRSHRAGLLQPDDLRGVI